MKDPINKIFNLLPNVNFVIVVMLDSFFFLSGIHRIFVKLNVIVNHQKNHM